jgi:hypothetical protein
MALPSALELRERLAEICEDLPEVVQRPGGDHDQHVAYLVRKKTFAYFTDDEHGDGRLALLVKAPPGEQAALTGVDPERFFVPAYVGHRGWVGLRLDREPLDWDEAADLLTEAYRMTAPKRLAAELDGR